MLFLQFDCLFFIKYALLFFMPLPIFLHFQRNISFPHILFPKIWYTLYSTFYAYVSTGQKHIHVIFNFNCIDIELFFMVL